MAGKTRILMTADTIGGVWTYAMTLCGALRDYRFEIHLLTMGRLLNESQRIQVEALDNVVLYESSFKLEWMDDPWDDVEKARLWISDIYNKVSPDIVHFNNYVRPFDNWNSTVVTVFHSCVLTWFRSVKQEDAPQEWQPYRNLVTTALASSDVVVFPSAGIQSLAEEVYGRISHSQVIYNGKRGVVDINADKQPFVMSAGRLWDDAKNMAILCTAAKLLPWPLKIAGSNTSPDGEVFNGGNVKYLGEIAPADVSQYMQQASVFASAAVYEPFGLAVLEAASCGCALVLSDTPTFRELWRDAAIYCNPKNEDSVAAAIQALIDDEVLRTTLSEKAKQRAENFTASIMAESYIALYQRQLEKQLQHSPLNT